MPVNTTQPHSSWAEVYDLAYERLFGEFYHRFTEKTVEVISARVAPPARIVDFGAGTGRISLPLAERDYEVTAVDPCQAMLDQLQNKDLKHKIRTVCSKMEDYRSRGEFDVALCIFTVLLYLLNEESLKKALEAAHASLKPGGILLIDIPSEAIFSGILHRDEAIDRSVSVVKQEGNIYNYREELKIKHADGNVSQYNDNFQIRYWPPKQIKEVLKDVGFVCEEDLTNIFDGTGSNYYVVKKVAR